MKTVKRNENFDKLKDLLKKIQAIKRITQGKISILAGYETENYLSEVKSTGNISDNIIERLEMLYERAQKNPDILKADKIPIEKTDQQIIEERGDRLFALEVAMKALTGIVLDMRQKVFKETFSEVTHLWDEKIAQEHKFLTEKLKNE